MSEPHRLPLGIGVLLLLLLALAPPARAQSAVGRVAGLPSEAITALAWDGTGMWVGTLEGLGRVEGEVARTVAIPLAEREIRALLVDGDSLWIGTPGGLIHRFPDGEASWRPGDAGLAGGWVTALVAHQGEILVGSYTAGLLRPDGEGWRAEPGGPRQVTALLSLGERLWVGSPRGLWSWAAPGGWRAEPALGPVAVNALAASGGELYVGSDEGLYRQESLGGLPGWVPVGPERPVRRLVATPGGLLSEHDLPAEQRPTGSLLYADGRLWVGTMGRGLVAEGLVARRERPPVVLVHGLGDRAEPERSGLRFLAAWLARDGYPVTIAPVDQGLPFLTQRAQLRQTVRAIKRRHGSEQVLLIGHSYGGLLARAYAADGAGDVAGLVTLGTPNGGLRLVYDFIVGGLDPATPPAEVALLPEHLSQLAPYLANDRVPQLHVGGDILPRAALLEGFPPSDGLVTAASATAAPGQRRIEPLAHGWTLGSFELALPSLLWPDDLYQGTIRPWLHSLPPNDPAPDEPLPAPGQSRLLLLDRSLAPDESATVAVELDGAAASWLLAGQGLAMTLVAPDGTRYRPDQLLLSDQLAHLPALEQLLPLDLWGSRGRPGRWQATIVNEGPTARHARLALIRPTAPALEIFLPTPIATPGQPIPVEAVAPAGLAPRVTLGGESALLEAQPSGRYAGTINAPLQPGYHPLRLTAGELERWAVVLVPPRSPAIGAATVSHAAGRAGVSVVVEGEGQVALGLTLVDGEQVIARRLAGPFRLRDAGSHELRVALPLPEGLAAPRLQWQLFDSRGALIPLAPPTEAPLP